MSPIMDLLAAIKDKDDIVDVGCDAIEAGADLQRLVEWVKRQDHRIGCPTEKDRECNCGLSEIQSLLGE